MGLATSLRACLLLAATALKVSQPEAPSTRRFSLDECKRRTALLQQAALRNDAVALRALLEHEGAASEDAASEGTESADGLAKSAGGPGANAESAAWSVDGLGANGYTVLIVAANNGHLAAAEVLCAHGASTDAKGKAALTALHAAAGQGHAAMVDALCARGASVDPVTELGFTPLMYGARA